MAKTKPKAKDKDVPKPPDDERVWGRDTLTHKKLFLLRGTPGFTPDK